MPHSGFLAQNEYEITERKKKMMWETLRTISRDTENVGEENIPKFTNP